MASSQNNFEIRKALSWSSIYKMKSIWNAKMEKCLKITIFKATLEPFMLLYSSECWIIDSIIKVRKSMVLPSYLE